VLKLSTEFFTSPLKYALCFLLSAGDTLFTQAFSRRRGIIHKPPRMGAGLLKLALILFAHFLCFSACPLRRFLACADALLPLIEHSQHRTVEKPMQQKNKKQEVYDLKGEVCRVYSQLAHSVAFSLFAKSISYLSFVDSSFPQCIIQGR
jgi:hypothetical protein